MHMPSAVTFFAALLGFAALSPVLGAAVPAGRPVATGSCCIANTSLKEDACTTAAGAAGRCVPGGNNCKTLPIRYAFQLPVSATTDEEILVVGGSALSCIAQADLTCDASIVERGNSLCRANAPGGGFIDGANIIKSLSQAKVN